MGFNGYQLYNKVQRLVIKMKRRKFRLFKQGMSWASWCLKFFNFVGFTIEFSGVSSTSMNMRNLEKVPSMNFCSLFQVIWTRAIYVYACIRDVEEIDKSIA
ncbi:hypothetical protein MTR_8g067440 [Medicago truncatula]|uniref:Uncharacterized protein n=1 Tax=Medicago truncatula TaxID=3880 RepID=G7LHS4_MEDTR|nr:hypothetical protein MTR_8g067440 [Medicago truncatula]